MLQQALEAAFARNPALLQSVQPAFQGQTLQGLQAGPQSDDRHE